MKFHASYMTVIEFSPQISLILNFKMAAVFPRNLKMKGKAQWPIVKGECCRGDQPNVLNSGDEKELNRAAKYGVVVFYGQAALHVKSLMLIDPE